MVPTPPLMIPPWPHPFTLVDSCYFTFHPSFERLSYSSNFHAWVSMVKATLGLTFTCYDLTTPWLLPQEVVGELSIMRTIFDSLSLEP